MHRVIVSLVLFGFWGLAYSDWLAPGWLMFGVPSSWKTPLTTSTTYDVSCLSQRVQGQANMSPLEPQRPQWAQSWLGQQASALPSCPGQPHVEVPQ